MAEKQPLLSGLSVSFALLLSAAASAGPVNVIFENFPSQLPSSNRVFLLGYDSLADFAAPNLASNQTTGQNFQTGGDIAGFTFDGNQYHVLFENFPSQLPSSNTVFLLSYNSLADFVTPVLASNQTTGQNFQTGGDIAGFTFDGNQYHILFENSEQFNSTVFLLSYNSLNDIVNPLLASNQTTAINLPAGTDIAGFTFDGSQYHVVLESIPLQGNQVSILSFDSLADIVSGIAANTVTTGQVFQTGGDVAGVDMYMPGPQTTPKVPTPTPLALLLLGTVGIVSNRFRRC